MQDAIEDVESRAEMVRLLGDLQSTGLLVLDDAVAVAELWGDEAVEQVEQRAKTFLQQRAMPYGDNDVDDLAVGTYKIAQAAIESMGGESLRGSGAGAGFNARSAYKRNMYRLAEMTDGVEFEELDVDEPGTLPDEDEI